MKQFLLIACLSFFTLGLSAQVVFVDADATGAGDGSSWADAYTDLNIALLSAPAGGSVWIADGTYTTPDTVSFFINKELTVLGGFNGTETMADEADPAANATILSGDVAGDDPAADMAFDTAAFADNNRVLLIADTSTVVGQYTVTIDGLTIANGGSPLDRPDGAPLADFAGGGILGLAKVAVSRVTFKQNRMFFGSALSLLGLAANGSVLDDITFDDNYSGPFRMFYGNGVDDLTIKNSTFDGTGDVAQQSGFLRFDFVTNSLVEACTFTNSTTAFSGAGMRADQSDNITVRGCTFDNLNGSAGSGIYLIQGADFDSVQDEDDFLIDGCTFTNNVTGGDGGAIAGIRVNLKVINSNINDNNAFDGAGIYHVVNDTRSYTLDVNKSNFLNNASDNNFGGAFEVLIFGANAVINGTVTGSVFEGNTVAGSVGGAGFYIQGTNNFDISNTRFEDNVSTVGSTIFTRTVAGLNLKNVSFINNGTVTESTAGMLTASFDDGAPGITIDSCTFTGNGSKDNPGTFDGGGAMRIVGGVFDAVPVSISNSTFSSNAANEGGEGGAIRIYNATALTIDNVDFLDNSAGGEGGAISISRGIAGRDTTDAGIITTTIHPFTAKISNSRFFNHIAGTQGGAISTQRAGIDIDNSVFVNNSVGPDGAGGGAIIFNGNAPTVDMDNNVEENGGSFTLEATLVNNTFVNNLKGQTATATGEHVTIFQPGAMNAPDSNSFKLTVLNNAFVLDDGGVAIETEPSGDVDPLLPIGDIIFETLGGNFFSDLNGVEYQVGDDDTVEGDNFTQASTMFVDWDANIEDVPNLDLVITDPLTDNPLINTGMTNALVPDEDIRGNPRGEAPDIGAFESDWGLTDTDEPVENSGLKLDFFPNPTANVLNIRNDDPTILNYDVLVADQLGRVLKAARFSGTNSRIDMTNLPAGVYNLRLVVNGNIYSKQVVKQ